MIDISDNRLVELKKNFQNKNIAVIGDVMLDCYYWGGVNRISPEAPVPIVEVKNIDNRFGGAANVAYNILTLKGNPILFGVIGNDQNAEVFRNLLRGNGMTADSLIVDANRPTTVKTRVIGNNQQLLRLDSESVQPISEETKNNLLSALEKNIHHIDGIILEDYNKGVLTAELIKEVVSLAKKHNVLITVDPKYHNFFEYKDVTVFKPNRKEAEDALKMKIRTSEDISIAGKKLLEVLNADYILLTLGDEGIAVFDKHGTEHRTTTKARKVLDVSGAGDTVIATLTMALASNAGIFEAAYLANYAAGIVIEELGIAPIEFDKLFSVVMKG